MGSTTCGDVPKRSVEPSPSRAQLATARSSSSLRRWTALAEPHVTTCSGGDVTMVRAIQWVTMTSDVPSRGAAPLKVAIIEDMRGIRESLGLLIDGTPGYRTVGSYGSMEEALL